MTTKKTAEPKAEPTPTLKSTDDGGLTALQIKADADAARGYIGPEKENS